MAGDGGTKRPVVIIGAMDVETNIIEAFLSDKVTRFFGEYKFVEGMLEGRPVVLARSYIGMTNSAAVAAIAIVQYKPTCVLSEGTAGGHSPSLHRGDIVLGKIVKNIHFVYTQHRALGEGSDPSAWEYTGPEMVFDAKIEERSELFGDERLLEVAVTTDSTSGKVVAGTIGSGDLWDREVDRILMFHREMGTDCEDMESFAIAQVCHQFGVPFLSVRILSNSELHPSEEYVRTIGEDCQRFVIRLLKSLMRGQD